MMKATILAAIGLGEAGANVLDAIAEDYGAKLDAQDITNAIENNADNVTEVSEELIRRLYERAIETATIEPYVVDARPSVGYKRTVYATLAEAKAAFYALEQEYKKEN